MTIDSLILALRTSPPAFLEVMQTLPNEALRWSDGGWSIAAILAHLGMSDVFTRERLHHIVSEREPILVVFRSDQIIPVGGNPAFQPDEMFARWQALRLSLCTWLETVPEQEWRRCGRHPERGQISFRGEVEDHLNHDLEHLAQAKAVQMAWQALQRKH